MLPDHPGRFTRYKPGWYSNAEIGKLPGVCGSARTREREAKIGPGSSRALQAVRLCGERVWLTDKSLTNRILKLEEDRP